MTEPAPQFDAHAGRYREELAQGLMLSGESSDFFLRGRLQRSAELLQAAGIAQPVGVLDFGCGVADAVPVLHELFPQAVLTGVDVSAASLAVAQSRHAAVGQFKLPGELTPASMDLVYCNGVFHHIPSAERAGAMTQIAHALKPGGALAFWDNNPWSPAARWVMSRIPFDHDAVMVWPGQARRLISDAGLQVERCEFHFIWPRALAWLRPTERWVRALPLAAQYLVWASKPH